MKSGRYFFILFLILLIMPAYAQKGVDITGTVIEEGTNEPIEQATVRLLSVKDSSMIGGVATSRNGSFMLKNIKNGSYLLHVRSALSTPACYGENQSGQVGQTRAYRRGNSIGRSCRDRESTGSNRTQRYDGVQCRFL